MLPRGGRCQPTRGKLSFLFLGDQWEEHLPTVVCTGLNPKNTVFDLPQAQIYGLLFYCVNERCLHCAHTRSYMFAPVNLEISYTGTFARPRLVLLLLCL